MEKVTFENVQELLDNGKKPEEVFDFVDDFSEGFTLVRLEGKWNHLNETGKILSPNQWFDGAWSFREGFASVRLNGKSNYIDKNGKILSPNQWFDNCENFNEGFGKVQINWNYNYIDGNGNLYTENKKLLNKSTNNCTSVEIPVELYDKLNYLGLIPNETRSHNVGKSDYSKHTIQPWAVWLDYNLNPWDADIVKRILRTKEEPGMSETEARIMDYQKIIHIAKERIRQLEFEKKKDA